jgi:cytochrome c oxidase accessory protein FixG
VTTCPTGIDIRDGLQMECIHCTQCIDACDAVMDKIGRPRGLIRYTSRDELAGASRRFLRPRVVFYPVLLLAVFGALGVALARRAPVDVTVLRGIGSPYTLLPSGDVSNQIRVKIANRTDEERRYLIELVDAPRLRLIAPDNPLVVGPRHSATAVVFVTAPVAEIAGGERDVRFRVSDPTGYATVVTYRLLGPAGPGVERR